MIYFTGEQYKLRYRDLMDAGVDPFQHYTQYGVKEGREVSFPEGWTPEGYLEVNPDIKNDPFWGGKPELHWLVDGAQNHRPYMVGPTPQPRPPGPTPGPAPTPGEWNPIVDKRDGKEIFCTLWPLVCEYGLGQGGPHILRHENGQLISELHIPDAESVMEIIDPGDGLPIAITEHWGRVYKRTPAQKWEKRFDSTIQPALGLGLVKANDAAYGVVNLVYAGKSESLLIKSLDKGVSWTKTAVPGEMCGIGTDGLNIRLVGYQNGKAVMTNRAGTVICSVPAIPGTGWWSVCGEGDVWNMGSFDKYMDGVDRKGMIYAWNGSKLDPVFTTDRPHIHRLKIFNGKRWAIASWDWNAPSNKTSLLLSASNPYDWKVETEIPCPHIIGMECRPEGTYLSGGEKDKYGKIFVHRP